MIRPEDLNTAMNEANPLLAELQRLYGCLPDTRCCCDQPGVCCAFLPEMTWVEALQWIDFIQRLTDIERSDTLKAFISFYMTNPVHHSGCPFLKHDVCSIYEVRPFACRAYGLWSRQFGAERTELNRRERKNLLDSWKRYGLKLPKDKVEFEIDYCEQVQCQSRSALSDDQLIDILEKIYRLDQNFPELKNKFEGEYHSDFSFLVTALILGTRKSILAKFAVIKEMVNQGSTKRLEAMLVKVTPNILGVPAMPLVTRKEV